MHGEKDPAVPASRSRLAFEQLKSIGRKVKAYKDSPDPNELAKQDCIYREIQGAGHNCFLPWKTSGAVELGKMMHWMLAQRRKDPADLDKAGELLAEHGKRFGWVPSRSPVGSYGGDERRKRKSED